MNSLAQAVTEKEEKMNTTEKQTEAVIETTNTDHRKSKVVSFRIRPEIWEEFKQTAYLNGTTPNEALCSFARQYTLEQRKRLKELDAM